MKLIQKKYFWIIMEEIKTKVCSNPNCEHGGEPQSITNFIKIDAFVRIASIRKEGKIIHKIEQKSLINLCNIITLTLIMLKRKNTKDI